MTYSEKLKDPRWQKKRLEIFQRDNFKCQCCRSVEKTLAVHHRWYLNGADPWDYEDEALMTLCEECHEQVKDNVEDCKSNIGMMQLIFQARRAVKNSGYTAVFRGLIILAWGGRSLRHRIEDIWVSQWFGRVDDPPWFYEI